MSPSLVYPCGEGPRRRRQTREIALVNSSGGNDIPRLLHATAPEEIPGILERCLFGAAMAGIVMFTRVLAIEAKRHGIRANAITPSMTSGTADFDRILADPFAGKMFATARERASLGLVAKEEPAALIVFLASPAAAKMTGQATSPKAGCSRSRTGTGRSAST